MLAQDTSSRSDMYAYLLPLIYHKRGFIERTSFPLSSLLKGDNSKGQLEEATILACDTPSSPDIYECQILAKYLKGYKSY